MGWKIVRDRQPEYSVAHGVSGQWRVSPDPVSALAKKIFEEAGEYIEHREAAELYDLRDVVNALIDLTDPFGVAAQEHGAKIAAMGVFDTLTEWCPVPANMNDGNSLVRRRKESL